MRSASEKVEGAMKNISQRDLFRAVGVGLFLLCSTGGANTQRSVGPVERGSIFMTPKQNDWSQVGIYVGNPKAVAAFKAMRPDAIKVAHGRIQHFCPKDENAWAVFPYSELKAYEEAEIAAGRDPIFVTATYQGKKRPVYFKWSLGSPKDGEAPKKPQAEWRQAVNVQDDRFVRFWVERYARKIWPKEIRNMWMGADECAFMYSLYGVLDDAGKFVSNVKWDRLFPQNNAEFLNGIETFFRKLKQTAPDVNVMCNLGSLEDWRKFPEVYADVPGIMSEDIVEFMKVDPKAYVRRRAYEILLIADWMAQRNRVALLRAIVPDSKEETLATVVSAYTLVRGENFFFAPQGPKAVDTVDIARLTAMQNALGKPTEPMQSEREPGTSNDGYRWYSRRCGNGLVFLNLTGKTKTVSLPASQTYYDRAGKRIRAITLDDVTGDYVLTRPPQG